MFPETTMSQGDVVYHSSIQENVSCGTMVASIDSPHTSDDTILLITSEDSLSLSPLLPTNCNSAPHGNPEKRKVSIKSGGLWKKGKMVTVAATVAFLIIVGTIAAYTGSSNLNGSSISLTPDKLFRQTMVALPEITVEANNITAGVVEKHTGKVKLPGNSRLHHPTLETMEQGTPTTTSVVKLEHWHVQQRADNQQQLYFNNRADLKKRAAEICNPNTLKTVVLCVRNHLEWDDLLIDCPNKIHSLKIDCSPSLKNIDDILYQTTNVGKLQIQCDKIGLHNHSLPFTSERPNLVKLRTLGVHSRNVASDCGDFFTYFTKNVRHSNLTKVAIKGIAVVDRNTAEIQLIISKVKYSAMIGIILSNVAMHAFLDITSKGGSVNFSKVHFQPIYNTHAARKTVDNLLTNANYIKDFLTTVPFQGEAKEMQMMLKIFGRLRTQSLDITLRMKEGMAYFSFDFVSLLKHLNHFALRLVDWEKGNHTENYLLLTDLSQLPGSLSEFQISTNFKTLSNGSTSDCRNFEKTTNSIGGMTLDLNLCPDCNIDKGCMRLKKR